MKAVETSATHLWLVLMKAHQAMERAAMASIAATGMCLSDFGVLEVLLHKGPLPVNAIGEKVRLTSGSATTAIDRLERRKLVRRADDPGDRRARIVHLTRQGRDLIEELFARHKSDLELATQAMTRDQRAQLIRLLRQLGTSVSPPRAEGNLEKENR